MENQKAPAIIRVIDYETTGIPEDEFAEVIEFGRVDVDLKTLDVINPWSRLSCPSHPIPAITMAIHHITDQDVSGCPNPEEIWPDFWNDLEPSDIVAAHNAKFEQHFHDGDGRKWICTYKCSRIVWPDAPSHGNQALRYWLELDRTHEDFEKERAFPPHRALPDAYVTAHILVELLKAKPVEELVKISKWPALLRDLAFGKHRGTKYQDAPSEYLEWICDKSDLDEDTKFTAKYWLQRRLNAEE